MYLGAYANVFSGGVFGDVILSTEEVFDYFHSLGLEGVELGAYGTPGHPHMDVDRLMEDADSRRAYRELLNKYELRISDFCCHGNAVHPNAAIAAKYDKAIHDGILLAERMEVPVIICDPGCPGSDPDAKEPNWVVNCSGNDVESSLNYQWERVMIPYWAGIAGEARAHGVHIAFEIHGGSPIHNARTFFKLREAIGSEYLGVNYDFAQLMWQGIDTCATLRALGDAVFHIHCKDCQINEESLRLNGYLDGGLQKDDFERPWRFCTVGYGHDELWWKRVFTCLHRIGYRHALSVEQEDRFMPVREGFERSIDFVKRCMIPEHAEE